MTTDELQGYMKRTHNLNYIDLKGLSKGDMLSVERAMRNYTRRFRTYIDDVRAQYENTHAYAYVRPFSHDNRTLVINTKYVGERGWLDQVEKQIGTHHTFDHPLGDKALDSIVTHEMTHGTALTEWVGSEAEHKFLMKAGDLFDKHRDRLISITQTVKDPRVVSSRLKKETISRYATKNVNEFVAEAVADALTGDTPCDISKKVLKLFNETFGREGL